MKRQSPDISRAEFLLKEANTSMEGLNERIRVMSIDNKNANSIIKDCYDIIMELIRARMLLVGRNATGPGAHEAEVAYMKILGFNEADIRFADQLRFFRNGMLYYGTMLDAEYAEKVVDFTRRLYPRLSKTAADNIR